MGENLEISGGKNGVKFIPTHDKPKSAIAKINKMPPIICNGFINTPSLLCFVEKYYYKSSGAARETRTLRVIVLIA